MVHFMQELPISSGPALSPAHIAANMEAAQAELLNEALDPDASDAAAQ